MKSKLAICLIAVCAPLVPLPAFAQPFIFPNNGQTSEQQASDRGGCESWAREQTGFDPMMASSAPPPSGQATQGGVVRGGARGAATGAVVGAIAGNAGRGAAMGAAAGGMFGGMRRNDQRRQQEAEQRNWQANQNQARANFNRAFGACMEGKGYTVR